MLVLQTPSEKEQLQGDADGDVKPPGDLDLLPQEPAAQKRVKEKKAKLQKERKPVLQAIAEPSQSKAKELKVHKELRHQPEPAASSSGSEESEEDEDDSGESDLSEGEKAVRRRWRVMRGLEAPSDGSSDETSSEDWSDEEELTVVPQRSTVL